MSFGIPVIHLIVRHQITTPTDDYGELSYCIVVCDMTGADPT